MTEQLRTPGCDHEVHLDGDHTPVGYIQNASYSINRQAVHVEAVLVRTWEGDRMTGGWQQIPSTPRIRLTIGPDNGEGWAVGHIDLTHEQLKDLLAQLKVEGPRLWRANQQTGGKR